MSDWYVNDIIMGVGVEEDCCQNTFMTWRQEYLNSERIASSRRKGRKSSRNGSLLELDAQASEKGRKFLMQFEIYLVVKGKDEKPVKLKVNMLLHCAGPEAIEEYSHFVFNKGESKKLLRRCL